MNTTTRPRDLTPDLIAGAGVTVAFAFGSAGGFEHTVTLAHRNGAGDGWDIVTATCVEVLAVTGTAMWVSFNRRGWPTRWPLALVVLGVLMTFGAQMAYRAAPAPNAVLGYVVSGTPTVVALLLILVAHLAHGYAASHSTPSDLPVPGTSEPEIPALAVPDQSVPEYVPEELAIPEPVPTPIVETPEPPSTEYAQQITEVRKVPVSSRTGKPTIGAVRAHFGIGQEKATKLINEAYPEKETAGGRKQNDDLNQPVGEDGGGEARGENEPSHHCNPVDQGSEPAADAVEDGLLRLVKTS